MELSKSLYENEQLLAESHTRVEQLIHDILAAIERPKIAAGVEDYIIFSIESYPPTQGPRPGTVARWNWPVFSGASGRPLADQEIQDATSCRISYGVEDAALIDWHSAVLFGKEMDDVRTVLEFANVELLEMRMLDDQLDRALTKTTKRSRDRDTTHIARLQVDGALLFERVTNTLKLLGDQYLARAYRLVSQRFNLESWDASILRKLETWKAFTARCRTGRPPGAWKCSSGSSSCRSPFPSRCCSSR